MEPEEELRQLLANEPKAADHTTQVNAGTKKDPQIIQQLDSKGLEAARQRFYQLNGPAIKSLQDRIANKGTASNLATDDLKSRAEYLKGPTHQFYSDLAIAPPVAGGTFGFGLARATVPRAPVGAGPTARLLGMVGPLAEASLGPGADIIAHATQGPNQSEHGKDVTTAFGNAGLGEAAGALAGGVYQMGLTAPETYRDYQKKLADEARMASLKPQVDAIKTQSLTPPAAPLSEKGQKMVDLARNMGAPDAALASHETAANFVQAANAKGLTDAQTEALRAFRKAEGMGATASFKNVIGRYAPAVGISAAFLSAFKPSDANSTPLERAGDVANAASYAIPVVGEARMLHDMMRSTPQIPEDATINGHSIIHPDDRAEYFKRIRDVANAFAQNRADYTAPRAGINPNDVYQEPVFHPGSPYAPGSENIARGAAYAQPNGYGRQALARALLGQ